MGLGFVDGEVFGAGPAMDGVDRGVVAGEPSGDVGGKDRFVGRQPDARGRPGVDGHRVGAVERQEDRRVGLVLDHQPLAFLRG